MDFLETLKNNWNTVAAAPWAFVTIICLFGGGGILLGRLWQGGVVANLESRLALKEDVIADYERQLQGATPDEAAKNMLGMQREIYALRQELGPQQRSLTEHQIEKIVLTAGSTPGVLLLQSKSGNPKNHKYAAYLRTAFEKAGWTVIEQGVVRGEIFSDPKQGMEILLPKVDSRAATAAYDALSAANVEFALSRYDQHAFDVTPPPNDRESAAPSRPARQFADVIIYICERADRG